MSRKEHLTMDGLQKIINIRSSMNLGLSDKLKAAFPQTSPVLRPEVTFNEITDPAWVAGFVDGEACFFINHYKSSTRKLGFGVQCVFYLSFKTRI